MNIKEYISKGKSIVEKHNLAKYVDVLLDYWQEHPTTLGHGFEHVLRVAVKAYKLAILNGFDNPEQLFIGGLYHDIHRPAEGKDGEEDQTKGAEIVAELFQKNDFDQNVQEAIVKAIRSHDSWRRDDKPPQFDLLLSVADKAAHSIDLAISYIWASNKYFKDKGEQQKFNNHLDTYYLCVKYQTRAWEILYKYHVVGKEEAILSYMNIAQSIIEMYKMDQQGRRYQLFLDDAANDIRKAESRALQAFGKNAEQCKKLMAQMY